MPIKSAVELFPLAIYKVFAAPSQIGVPNTGTRLAPFQARDKLLFLLVSLLGPEEAGMLCLHKGLESNGCFSFWGAALYPNSPPGHCN